MHKEGAVLEEHGRVTIGDGELLLHPLEDDGPLEGVVETRPFWPWIHDTLESPEVGFRLEYASELEAIAKAETRTDSVDARLLARMLVANLLVQEGRRWLQQEAWPWLSVEQRALAETHLELIDTLSPQVETLDDPIEKRGQEHPSGWQQARVTTAYKLCRAIDAGPSTSCSLRERYGAAGPGGHPADRSGLVAFHAASTAFTRQTEPPV